MAHYQRAAGEHGSDKYFSNKGSKKRLARITVRNTTPKSFWLYVILAIAFLALAVPWVAREHARQHQTRSARPR